MVKVSREPGKCPQSSVGNRPRSPEVGHARHSHQVVGSPSRSVAVNALVARQLPGRELSGLPRSTAMSCRLVVARYF